MSHETGCRFRELRVCEKGVCRLESAVNTLLCLETCHKIWTHTRPNDADGLRFYCVLHALCIATLLQRPFSGGHGSPRSWQDERMIVMDLDTRNDSH